MTLALMASMTAPALAQETTEKDSVFVVKDGVVVGAYEVGKDVDYLTFAKPETPTAGNYAQYGSTREELKSAIVIKQSGMVYVLASNVEGLTTYDDITSQGHYLYVSVPETLVGQEVTLSDYAESDDYVQAYYMDDDYNTLAGSSNWDLADNGYADGTIKVDLSDMQVAVAVNFTADASADEPTVDFTASYTGPYPKEKENSNTFTYDGTTKELKSAFYKMNEDEATVDFYLTTAAITDAKLVEDCYQYAHITVPYSALWSGSFDITGTTEFQFDFVDNINEESCHLSTGNTGSATGTISVAMQSTDTYTIAIEISNFGSGHTFSATYDGVCMLYDLSTPNAYRLQDQDDVTLRSAVVTHKDGLYTVYLSQKEGVTTVEGMADADIVVATPEEFLNDGLKGFSGDETRARVAVTYDGVTYSQANTTKGGDDALAIGGNAQVDLSGSQLAIDFAVYNIYKYNKANLTGHFEGTATVVE